MARRSLRQLLGPELPDHRGLRAIGALFLLLAGYALADRVLGPYAYAGMPPLAMFAVAGVAALLLGLRLGRGAARRERLAAATFLAAAAAAASSPLLLRVNALNAAPELVRYHYIGDSRYQADHGDYPNLALTRFPKAWLEQQGNATHEFALTRGVLGFYQYDQARFRDEMRDSFPPF